MHVITILYPKGDDTTFDMDYYKSTHMPMFAEAIGDNMSGWGIAQARGDQYHCVAWAMVADLDAYKAALAEHGARIMADVPNYTAASPVMITGDVVATNNG